MMRNRTMALCLAANLSAGCFGSIGAVDEELGRARDDRTPGSSSPDDPLSTVTPAPPGAKAPASLGGDEKDGACRPSRAQSLTQARLRRLSVEELYGTISHALGVKVDADVGAFPQDPAFGGYLVKNSLTLSKDFADALERKAREIAGQIIAQKVFPGSCLQADNADSCVRDGLQPLLEKMFRGPIGAEDIGRAYAMYTTGKAGSDAAAGVSLLLEYAMLNPRFLYHSEVGARTSQAAVNRLGPFELASQLSYALQGHGPDSELFDLARTGGLSNPSIVAAQARRLLTTESGKRRMATFFEQWLQLSHPTELQPVFGAFPATELDTEARRFFENVLAKNLSIPDVLSTSETFLSPRLQKHYKLSDGQVASNDHPRRGVLALGSFLASHGKDSPLNPIYRGVFLSDRVFCRGLPPPPQGVELTERPAAKEPQTPREILAMHRAEGAGCKACHRFIDPLGFALEEFDHLGRYRTVYPNGLKVDASGDLEGTDIDGKFQNYVDFVSLLRGSAQVQRCFVANYASFALAELLDNIDSCSSKAVHAHLRDGVKVADFIAGFVSSDWFLHRSVE